VGGQVRKVVKVKRVTDESKAEQKRQQAIRKKDADIFKASLKKKEQVGGEADDDSDWESVEEDYPGVKLSELLDGLTLEVKDHNEGDADDEVPVLVGADGKQVTFAEEEKKQR